MIPITVKTEKVVAHHHHRGGRLLLALTVNFLLTAVQVVAGLLAGSLALLADALHNFSDAIALLIALIAQWIARRPADLKRTFGYHRAELLGALINLTTLLLLAAFLIYQAVWRFLSPQPVGGWLMVQVGALAFLVDAVTVLLLWRGARKSLNIRAAFLHNLADALGSLAVIISGVAILRWGWDWIDPLCSILIAGYIALHALFDLRQTLRILMQSAPPSLDLERVVRRLSMVDGVEGLHHVHAWEIDEHCPSFEAHVVIRDPAQWEAIKRELKQRLAEEFGIHHSTLEAELLEERCEAPVCRHDEAHG